MSSHEKLTAAADARKARLAQLQSLKRKQAPSDDQDDDDTSPQFESATTSTSTALTRTEEEEPEHSITTKYLSGRNYDPTTRDVKLGFDTLPIADPTKTLEYKAQQLALETRAQQDADESASGSAQDGGGGADLYKLQPKKPNWDLKRDLEAKMKVLDAQTEKAIARLVRERVEAQKGAAVALQEQEQKKVGGGGKNNGVNGGEQGEGEEVGMEGAELVEAMHLKEQEEERDRERDAEDEVVS
ncbi:hypothetical protein N0V83_008960 [Neocucurbitaria cava]|uniref:Uncharacterized protein n=1 Tax=Neocucurbitaria cava TaxID=798079 RepID=A0A9W8Y223_9PLEO|nr:hypothetical protein N0V83_008960 [Neocucurbitaria cava]